MQKIQVLHIIKSLGRGGAETLLPETLKLHDRNRFQFHYIFFLPWKNQMVSSIEEAGGAVHCLPASSNFLVLTKSKEVVDFCRVNKINLIHCHLPWSGFLGRIVHLKTNIPVVYTEHNTQEGYHFVTRWLNKISYNKQSLALGVSEDVTLSINKNIEPKIPVRTLLNGVNTNFFQKDKSKGREVRNQLDIPDNAIVIGNLAVFREQKNLAAWLRVFEKVCRHNSNIYGILVGSGPKESEIRELVKEMNLMDRVKLPGLQTDTVRYFSAMDIFMMSSSFEGLPIALLEAMSMSCAIVSTRAGGVVEVVRHQLDGLTCEVGDEATLSELTEVMVSDGVRRYDFQKAARKRVEESFSIAGMVNSLEQIYEGIFQDNNPEEKKTFYKS